MKQELGGAKLLFYERKHLVSELWFFKNYRQRLPFSSLF